MSQNEQPSYGFGTLRGAGGRGVAHGTSLGLLGVSWALLGACQGCFGDPEGHFFPQVAYLIDVLFIFSRDMASPLKPLVLLTFFKIDVSKRNKLFIPNHVVM